MTGDPHFVVNVEAAIRRDGEFLVTERAADEDHAAGALSLVGGKVEGVTDDDAVLEGTVRREIREEVGVAVTDLQYVTSSAFVSDNGNQVVNVVFTCRHDAGEPTVNEPDEVASLDWLSIDEILDHPDVPEFTREYFRMAARQYED